MSTLASAVGALLAVVGTVVVVGVPDASAAGLAVVLAGAVVCGREASS